MYKKAHVTVLWDLGLTSIFLTNKCLAAAIRLKYNRELGALFFFSTILRASLQTNKQIRPNYVISSIQGSVSYHSL